MTFVQSTTGGGGWPMSVWLTPELQPFYGGTYFPPTSKWQRPGFIDILQEIARVWTADRAKVVQSAATIVERLRTLRRDAGHESVPVAQVLDRATREFAATFDARRGGFGDAPKFPRPSELLFLLRQHQRTGDVEARDMVLVTLRAMALGGMRDHLGGGFHRYSVDGDWRVPHFEKMLYDQAQLVIAYVEAAQVTGDLGYLDIALDTLEYVRRDLTDPSGGFYSAEDADSVPPEQVLAGRVASNPASTPDGQDVSAPPHKTEGAFYIWRDAEIAEVLGADADVFRIRFGIRPDGNAPHDPQGEFTGRNLLYTARSLDAVAAEAGRAVEEVQAALERGRAALFERREGRPRPHRDDKVLTAWNGLMIAGFARASRMLPREARLPSGPGVGYLQDAQRAAAFIKAQLWNQSSGTLLRRFRHGESGIEGYAEDYAYLVFGLLDLFQVDGDGAWLEWARILQEQQNERFWDSIDGGWFSTSGRDPSVLLRLKEDYDGAEPAATSLSVLNLLVLSHLFPEAGYEERIERAFGLFATRITQVSRAVPMMLAALSSYHAGMSQLVIVGEPDDPEAQRMLQLAGRSYLPFTVTVPISKDHRQMLARVLPWTSAMTMRGGKATAYLCRAFACDAPTTSHEELNEKLAALTERPGL
jgi:uncharacterized protein YyaL (SSP411 family)